MVRIDKKLSNLYRRLGYCIGLYPKHFLIGSIITAIALGSGFMLVYLEEDFNKLFIVRNTQRTNDKTTSEYFPTNYTGLFSPSRITSQDIKFVRIIVEAKDGGTIFRESIWDEILKLDELIHLINIEYLEQTYNYTTLCAMDRPEICYENLILDIGTVVNLIENRSLTLRYPVFVNPETYNAYILPLNIGGIEFNEENTTVISAKSLSLEYFINSVDIEATTIGNLWEEKITEALTEYESKWENITVYRYTYYERIQENRDNTVKSIPYSTISGIVITIFVLLSTFSRDCVKAKQLVGMSGMMAATLGSVAGFGFLSYLRVDLIGFSVVIPFIMLGIGLDDSFVMLSAWRQTSILDSVPDRLAQTYAEAAVSITITSLTDMLSFYVGILTPIYAVQIFCAYSGTCVLFIYIFQLTFFGACLALSGYQESKNKHAIFWWIEATPKSKSDKMGKIKRIFLTGGIDKEDPNNPIDNADNLIMLFFRDVYTKFLIKKSTIVISIVLYLVYISASVYGFTVLEENMKEEELLRKDSDTGHFLQKDFEYFKQRGLRMQVFIKGEMNYSDPRSQTRINKILQELGNSSKWSTHEHGENWLTGFIQYVEAYTEYYNFSIKSESDFISTLKEYYLPGSLYATDVKFNEDESKIVASRYIIQIYDTESNIESAEAVSKMREVSTAISDMEVFVYTPGEVFLDQIIYIRPMAIQLLTVAAVIAMLTVIIFIPDIVTSLCVFFTICSTEIGVIGLMSLWNVNLNFISVLCLVMCIGFAVDFSAHISYSYISSSGTSEERIRKSMYLLGLPIIQGGLSTVLALVVLNFLPSEFAKIFFKVVFLVISIAGFHSMLILPVAFFIIKPEQISKKKGEYDVKSN